MRLSVGYRGDGPGAAVNENPIPPSPNAVASSEVEAGAMAQRMYVMTQLTVIQWGMSALEKHGPWMIGCVALGFVSYVFGLEPMARERELYAATLRESVVANNESMRDIATSMESIATSAASQHAVMDRLDGAIEASSKTNLETNAILVSFSENVRKDHDAHNLNLEKLAEAIKESIE